MGGFVLHNYDYTSVFEFTAIQRWESSFIDASVTIRYQFNERTLSSVNYWSCSIGCLSAFLTELTTMYKDLKGTAALCSDDTDSLRLAMNDVGHILVQIKDGIQGYNGFVQIGFEMDQSFLPEIIDQLKSLLSDVDRTDSSILVRSMEENNRH